MYSSVAVGNFERSDKPITAAVSSSDASDRLKARSAARSVAIAEFSWLMSRPSA